MKITFDPAKRAHTLKERDLDFEDCVEVFAGPTMNITDNRRDYGEPRTITVGLLNGRMVVVVWTPRDDGRRIISMRKANDREETRFGQQLGKG
jgi:uncharacterized protein